MKIQINQINPKTLGFDYNKNLITECLKDANIDVLSIFPELSISGGILLNNSSYSDLYSNSMLVCESLLEEKRDMIFGTPIQSSEGRFNSLVMVQEGEVLALSTKKNLSQFDIGFNQGGGIELVKYRNHTLAFGFLEDLEEFAQEKIQTDLIIICSNYLYHPDSQKELFDKLIFFARILNAPIAFCNRFGAEGGYVYGGGSFILNRKGELCGLSPLFRTESKSFESITLRTIVQNSSSKIQNLHDALTIAIRDYFQKNGIKKAIIGLSGGIDSALVVALAVRALGKENVIGVLMPSEFSSQHSIDDALASANNLGIEHYTVPIKDAYNQCSQTYNEVLPNQNFNIAEENLQSRLRMITLMWFANKFGAGVLNTTNKSEAAVGYGTIYGDTSGAISILADVYKTEVWELSKYINNKFLEENPKSTNLPIPENSINKAPSAELRPGQKDTDSLPDYPILDRILKEHIENCKTAEEILIDFEKESLNVEKQTIEKVIRLVKINEWKRRQCPTPVKVSKSCFGLDRRVPIS
ncbi:MAG: NAD(+) synthase [Bacteroidales bacterium]|jgi:NAD+ synthase (glutamine-hydrolysing)|nr:NAD(+) synthase [Bacteroidales bacterium]MDD4703524.1 NAD(+) synthase [Bacteroidales bacterium]MDX9798631.1 NAD(+) synthase [Bacteroidales bacterium]